MKHTWIITYDITSDERRRRVFSCLKSRGSHLQYSVFRVVVSEVQQARLSAELTKLLHHAEDQVLLIDLGPSDGRGKTAVKSLGRSYRGPSFEAQVF